MTHWKRLTPYGRVKMVRNVLGMFEQATEGERTYGEAWYRVAHNAADRIGRVNGVGTRTVAAVIAALSPSNEWQSNLVDAERYVQAHVGGMDRPGSRTYGPNQRKAWDILAAGPGDLLRFFGPTAPKTRAFFLSIAEPNENHGTVVVDGHTYNIACGVYTSLSEVPDLGALGRYLPVSEAFCASAVIAGLTPQAMQATCWLTHRRLHLDVRADDFHPLITTSRIA